MPIHSVPKCSFGIFSVVVLELISYGIKFKVELRLGGELVRVYFIRNVILVIRLPEVGFKYKRTRTDVTGAKPLVAFALNLRVESWADVEAVVRPVDQ